MVAKTGWRKLLMAFSAAAVLSAGTATAAETRTDIELGSLASLHWTGEEMALFGSSQADIDFRNTDTRMVQARLQMRLSLLQLNFNDNSEITEDLGELSDLTGGQPQVVTMLQVPRASIRFRFPVTDDYMLRITAGRDRLSWGIGSLFNAADLLFGADGSGTSDFTRSEDVRDETAWLLSLYFPLGELGYLETVALPSLPGLEISLPAAQPVSPAIDETRAGLRLHSAVGPLSIEPSYLYDGQTSTNRIALSLQGTLLGADIYTAGNLNIPASKTVPAIDTLLRDNSQISAGVFRTFSIGYDQTLAARLEALVIPGADWNNQNEPTARYALQLHPEISWSPTRTLTVISRAMVSPIDHSAELTTGALWNIYQGFNALTFTSLQVGNSDTIYGWNRPGSFSLTAGFRYAF